MLWLSIYIYVATAIVQPESTKTAFVSAQSVACQHMLAHSSLPFAAAATFTTTLSFAFAIHFRGLAEANWKY